MYVCISSVKLSWTRPFVGILSLSAQHLLPEWHLRRFRGNTCLVSSYLCSPSTKKPTKHTEIDHIQCVQFVIDIFVLRNSTMVPDLRPQNCPEIAPTVCAMLFDRCSSLSLWFLFGWLVSDMWGILHCLRGGNKLKLEERKSLYGLHSTYHSDLCAKKREKGNTEFTLTITIVLDKWDHYCLHWL